MSENETTATENKVDLSVIENAKVFGAGELDGVGAYLEKVQEAAQAAGHDVDKFVTLAFDPSQDMPEGLGIAVIPFKERAKVKEGDEEVNRKVVKGIHVCRIPDAAYMIDKHGDKVTDIIHSAFITQLSGLIRRDSQKPQTITQFLEGASTSKMVAFDKLAGAFIKVLGTMSPALANMSKAKLKACLSSQTKASAYFPNMDGSNWDKIVEMLIKKAQAENIDPGVLLDWQENRHKVEDAEEIELDFGSIDLDDLDAE